MRQGLCFALMLAGSTPAAADVVTFSGLPAGFSPTPMTTYVESGITVTSLEGNFWAYPNPGELHLDPSGFGNSQYEFTYAGGLFDLISFDVTFAAGGIAYLWGYDENGLLLNELLVDGFGTIDINGFDSIHTLRIGNYGEHMSIDNFTFAAAGAVPEPSTWASLLLGFGIAGFALRRAQRSGRAIA